MSTRTAMALTIRAKTSTKMATVSPMMRTMTTRETVAATASEALHRYPDRLRDHPVGFAKLEQLLTANRS
jgi:hypothetical protein